MSDVSDMTDKLRAAGRFAAGATLGGLLVGIGEGLFRDVALMYCGLLYATLWALVGAAGGAFLTVLGQRGAKLASSFSWGLGLATSLSALVLGHFIIWRDILHEAPGRRWVAVFGAAVAAFVLFAIVHVLGRRLASAIRSSRPHGPLPWLVPGLALVLFAVATRAGDDTLPSEPPTAAGPLAGRGVILLVVDALRADALGVYGAKAHRGTAPSPNLDAFAKEALVFVETSAQASWTKPAMASIITSRHVSGHNTMSKMAVLPEGLPTVASELHSEGISTAAVVTNYNLEEGYGFARGFDEFHYLAPARYLGAPKRANRLAAYNVYRLLRERFLTSGREARHFYRSAKTVNAMGLSILDRIGNNDFFVWLHYMEPHDPYFDVDGPSYARVSRPRPPPELSDPMLRAYRDDVRRFDDALGELIGGLQARGLLARTTIIVASDHGEEFADHGGFYHGVTLYEEQLHVPLIIAGPHIPAGEETALARHIDIAPTVLARFGKALPASWEGRDLLGNSPAPDISLAEEDHEGNVLRSIREGNHKLILANHGNPRGLRAEELYDLSVDPGEQAPLTPVARHVAALTARLDQAQAAAKRGGAQATERAMDDAAEAELRALGYVQ